MSFNKSIIRLLPVALLLALQLPLGANTPPPRQDFEKTYSESFPIGSDGDVRLENRYGEIRVETWTKNEVSFEVRVRVSADDQEDADNTFDRIRIDFAGSGNAASAITSIGERKTKGVSLIDRIVSGDWDWPWEQGSANDFRVFYTVKMPATANLTTTAKYCDVTLPDLSGETNLSVGYGDLFAGDLSGSRNNLTVSYGSARVSTLGGRSEMRVRYSNGSVNEAGDLRYDGRYSDFRIGDVGNLSLDIGYEDLEIGNAKEVRMDGNYNDVELESATSLIIDGNYNEWSVGTLTDELDVESSYGDIEVDRITAGFTRIDIDVRYIDVELNIDSDAGYDMDLSARYGDISYDKGRATNVRSDRSGTSQTVSAVMPGKGRGRVNVTTSYGDIELE